MRQVCPHANIGDDEIGSMEASGDHCDSICDRVRGDRVEYLI